MTARRGIAGWRVGGRWYANSAALFWPGFVEDLTARWPGWAAAELSAPGPPGWDAGVLEPARSLAEDLAARSVAPPAREWEALVAELSLLGPPAGVRLRVLDGQGGVLADEAPPEVDAETFLFLAGWLLRWADLPDCLWSRPELRGNFAAEWPGSPGPRVIAFGLRTVALAEGLVHRQLTLRAPKPNRPGRDIDAGSR